MSKKVIFIVGLVLVIGLLGLAACFNETAKDGKSETPVNTEANNTTATAVNENDSPIKKVDFKNFEYTTMTDSKDGKEGKLVLKEGKLEKTDKANGITLGKVQYADLTNDKKDEAIVTLESVGDDKAKTNMVYVYTLENDAPKMLWSFETKGGEDSGLKGISAEKGNLLVEIFGDAKFEKGKWEITASKEKDKKQFTKTELKWNGKEFAVEGKPEVKDIDSKT